MNKEHHQKWINFASDRGICITNLGNFVSGKTDKARIKQLAALYRRDKNLNNIPLCKFDMLWELRLRRPGDDWALYQGACVYKALLIQKLIDSGEIDKTGEPIENRSIAC